MTIKADVQIDAKGLACPMPIVRTKKAMVDLVDGQILEVQATDRGSIADLAAWAQSIGHQYIGTIEQEDVLYHYLRKCSNEEIAETPFAQTITNEQLLSLTEGIVLDVREEVEYAFGHIVGAKTIPLGELDTRMHELKKEQPIYVICRTGKRSDLAAKKLASAGFDKVYNVLPGMVEWQGELEKKF
ncbi:sulfurtransferase TusA family protein [Metasolibacillus meyeri]|uniref:sulfurtransferase TusA family protein n=1 Tax=Metasolibacillus meyeri TaxID=1071052 RepID=UPI000D31ED9F|nr:sulfurtransferase TusA family protein [Metasolibacillus meyeri]